MRSCCVLSMTLPLKVCGFQGAIQRASTGFAVFVGILIGYRQIWQVESRKSPPSAGREARIVVITDPTTASSLSLAIISVTFCIFSPPFLLNLKSIIFKNRNVFNSLSVKSANMLEFYARKR